MNNLQEMYWMQKPQEIMVIMEGEFVSVPNLPHGYRISASTGLG